MGKKSGFTSAEIEEIKRLYLQEGRSILQIPKILGKGCLLYTSDAADEL